MSENDVTPLSSVLNDRDANRAAYSQSVVPCRMKGNRMASGTGHVEEHEENEWCHSRYNRCEYVEAAPEDRVALDMRDVRAWAGTSASIHVNSVLRLCDAIDELVLQRDEARRIATDPATALNAKIARIVMAPTSDEAFAIGERVISLRSEHQGYLLDRGLEACSAIVAIAEGKRDSK